MKKINLKKLNKKEGGYASYKTSIKTVLYNRRYCITINSNYQLISDI